MAIINEYLNQFKGETISEKISKDCSKYLLEEKIKQNHFSQVALVSVLDPKTKEIKNLGGSVPSDLINDNLGEWLAMHNQTPAGFARTFPQIEVNGLAKTMNFTGLANIYNDGGSQGSRIQIGSGSTAPARSDFAVSNPFIVSPESLQVGISASGFYDIILGRITYTMNMISGGSGSIAETASFQQWRDATATQFQCMIAHDLISPSVPFVATQLIAVTYTWQI